MAEWWSIEVLHGESSAAAWRDERASDMIEAALTNGALDASWQTGRWGVAFEVLFEHEEQWEAFRNLPLVRASLDAVPDPVHGLLIYRGRGGGASTREPRRPKRPPAAGAMELPEPIEDSYLDLTVASPPDSVTVGAGDRPNA